MRPTRSEEAAVLRSVKRACHSGLDSVTLRREVVRRLAPMVPYQAYSFSTTDPDTGLLTHTVGAGVPSGVVRLYVESLYLMEEAIRARDRARIGQAVSTVTLEPFRELLRTEGVEHELNMILFSGGGLWGDLCLLRMTGAREYGRREIRFMERIAPHVARGLRSAAMLEAASAVSALAGPEGARLRPGADSPPGVLVLDALGRIQLRSPAAAEQLDDLADIGVDTGTPYAIASALAQLRARQGAGADPDDRPGEAGLRVRGRSGAWYTIRAAPGEPNALLDRPVIVTIEPLAPGEIASILSRLYGLSPREREVLALAARGASTKEIAARLGLSIYTVQEHFGRACEKVGVRGRRALLARFYYDGSL